MRCLTSVLNGKSLCVHPQAQVDVRNITSKISDLNEKLDVSATLVEPRENAFMAFEHRHNTAANDFALALSQFGKVTISKTFPALCVAAGAALRHAVAHLRSTVSVTTVDYHGNPRTSGGDPLTAELKSSTKGDAAAPVDVQDNDDGTYTLSFTPISVGEHQLMIKIFDRPIKDSPFTVDVTNHIEFVEKFGGSGQGAVASSSMKQPVSVAVSVNAGEVYVLDAGNSRVVVLDRSLRLKRQLAGVTGLEDRGAVGLALNQATGNLVIVNWRTKKITELNPETGEVVRQITSPSFVAPTAVAVTSRNEFVVADNEAGSILILDSSGAKLAVVGAKGNSSGQFLLINAVYCTPNDEIIVCDHRLQVHMPCIRAVCCVFRVFFAGI